MHAFDGGLTAFHRTVDDDGEGLLAPLADADENITSGVGLSGLGGDGVEVVACLGGLTGELGLPEVSIYQAGDPICGQATLIKGRQVSSLVASGGDGMQAVSGVWTNLPSLPRSSCSGSAPVDRSSE